jgi:hypothetical protein
VLISRNHRKIVYLTFFFLATISTLSVTVPQARSQSAGLTSSSFQAFDQLQQVYQIGGTAPDLVAKLNVAIAEIQEAKILRTQGNQSGAANLEQQAQSMITQLESAIPPAQLTAREESTSRTILVIVSVPLAVIVSSLMFYTTLRIWRWYQREKLFEMRIVYDKKAED